MAMGVPPNWAGAATAAANQMPNRMRVPQGPGGLQATATPATQAVPQGPQAMPMRPGMGVPGGGAAGGAFPPGFHPSTNDTGPIPPGGGRPWGPGGPYGGGIPGMGMPAPVRADQLAQQHQGLIRAVQNMPGMGGNVAGTPWANVNDTPMGNANPIREGSNRDRQMNQFQQALGGGGAPPDLSRFLTPGGGGGGWPQGAPVPGGGGGTAQGPQQPPMQRPQKPGGFGGYR